MHKYLEAIGYGNIIKKKQLVEFLKDAEDTSTRHMLISLEEDYDYCEYEKGCGSGIGVSICGNIDSENNFVRQYYYPFFIGSGVTSEADVAVERHMDRDAYVGICEDIKIGISLIFHLLNTSEYLKEKHLQEEEPNYISVTLSGLCNNGTILFPVMKDKELERKSKEESRNRMMLMSAAKNGDQEAIESLTLDDIDIYSKVSRRLITEDVFSIVDTYFMPFGIECDQYSILGEILSMNTIVNEDTDEKIYIMRLDVNELQFDVCVPARKITGEPKVGRRFKGNIWLQGKINF